MQPRERTGSDRLQHLKIAKGSVFETDAALDLFVHRRLIKLGLIRSRGQVD